MPVLIRHRAAMSPAQYDESAPPLIEKIKKQPGFLFHASYEDADGLVVAEVWETQEDQDDFMKTRRGPALHKAGVTGKPKRAEWSKARAHHHPRKPSGKAKHSAS